jgi:hypothetical protein
MAFADAGDYEIQPLSGEPPETALRRRSAQVEDSYWSENYWKEPYFRADYDYEDYAPAYCVGYSGCAQYGGRFEDAEKSLCANFLRIKGDSRLQWDEASEAARSAWSRAAGGRPGGAALARSTAVGASLSCRTVHG